MGNVMRFAIGLALGGIIWAVTQNPIFALVLTILGWWLIEKIIGPQPDTRSSLISEKIKPKYQNTPQSAEQPPTAEDLTEGGRYVSICPKCAKKYDGTHKTCFHWVGKKAKPVDLVSLSECHECDFQQLATQSNELSGKTKATKANMKMCVKCKKFYDLIWEFCPNCKQPF